MKKTISLLLVLVLCLSLCACGGGNDTPDTIPNAESGTTPHNEENEATEEPESGKDILGKWFVVGSTVSLSFNDDGTGIRAQDGQEVPLTWKYDSETNCYIIDILGAILSGKAETVDGIEQLNFENSLCVRSENYTVPTTQPDVDVQYKTVEITMDNWMEYFEFVFIEDWQLNGFGESGGYSCEYRLKLRDEYASKINLQSLAITVEVAYKDVVSYATFDFEKMEYTIDGNMSSVGEKSTVWEITSLNEELCTSNNLGGNVEVREDSDYFYQILEPTISRIQGTIELVAE